MVVFTKTNWFYSSRNWLIILFNTILGAWIATSTEEKIVVVTILFFCNILIGLESFFEYQTRINEEGIRFLNIFGWHFLPWTNIDGCYEQNDCIILISARKKKIVIDLRYFQKKEDVLKFVSKKIKPSFRLFSDPDSTMGLYFPNFNLLYCLPLLLNLAETTPCSASSRLPC